MRLFARTSLFAHLAFSRTFYFLMPHYLIQNSLGEFLTRDALWTNDRTRALAFDDIRGLMRICERERLYDAHMIIDFCDSAGSRIAISLKDIVSTPASARARFGPGCVFPASEPRTDR